MPSPRFITLTKRTIPFRRPLRIPATRGPRKRARVRAAEAAGPHDAALGTLAPPPRADLRFPVEAQAKTEWCWAAVGASLGRHLGTRTLSQCELATEVTGEPCCPLNPSSSAGNVPRFLEEALGRVRLAAVVRGRVAFSTIKQRIGATVRPTPVPVQIRWNDSDQAHFVYLDGYSENPGVGDPTVVVRDPIFGTTRSMSLSQFTDSYPDVRTGQPGRWFATFLLSVPSEV